MKFRSIFVTAALIYQAIALGTLHRHKHKSVARFEPDDHASDDLWQRVACKGGRLVAAMLGTDEDAGKRIEDKRTPPSAASFWQGNLNGSYTILPNEIALTKDSRAGQVGMDRFPHEQPR